MILAVVYSIKPFSIQILKLIDLCFHSPEQIELRRLDVTRQLTVILQSLLNQGDAVLLLELLYQDTLVQDGTVRVGES